MREAFENLVFFRVLKEFQFEVVYLSTKVLNLLEVCSVLFWDSQ